MSGGATSDAKFILKRGIWGKMGEVKSCEGYVGGTNRHLVIPLYQPSRDSRVRLFAWKITCKSKDIHVHVVGTTWV